MGNKKTVEEMVEGLAIAVQNGFEGVTEELRGVKVRLDKVEDRLTGVEKGLAKVEFRSSDMTSRVATLEEKMQIVSKKLGFQ